MSWAWRTVKWPNANRRRALLSRWCQRREQRLHWDFLEIGNAFGLVSVSAFDLRFVRQASLHRGGDYNQS